MTIALAKFVVDYFQQDGTVKSWYCCERCFDRMDIHNNTRVRSCGDVRPDKMIGCDEECEVDAQGNYVYLYMPPAPWEG